VGKTGAHTLVETDSYTDSNGNSYKWYGYNDQTAEIYEIVPFADQVTLDIPSEIGGYKVSGITGTLKNQTLESVTIPETIAFLGESAFERAKINHLYYNAVDAATEQSFFFIPFAYAEIGEFHVRDNVETIEGYSITIGDEVQKLPNYFFAKAHFKFTDYTVTVPKIGYGCFYAVWENNSFDHYPVNLTVSDQVTFIGKNAFAHCVIDSLEYNSNATNDAAQVTDGVKNKVLEMIAKVA